MKIKICGITREEDLKMACSLGADAVGFVVGVPSSPRSLSLDKAKGLLELVPEPVKRILVTAPGSLEYAVDICESLRPDALQIHGEKGEEFQSLRGKSLGIPLVRALSIKPGSEREALKEALREARFFDAILLDSFAAGRFGGTGIVHDWNISRRIRESVYPKPLILAGGLKPENVKEAIEKVMPYAVDVSSGVESKPGVKDPGKVKAFIRNARKVAMEDASETKLW
ncbi:phosphoribosylanthranilate isomerase [Candidatus Bathyarchaeota archaeon]|nr:phosphoribosylanthranilate isomerase [Candidatus Bathyarchaeota archaeon]